VTYNEGTSKYAIRPSIYVCSIVEPTSVEHSVLAVLFKETMGAVDGV